jgi:hypothetical protein
MVDDITVMEEQMLRERNRFEIVELRTPETGGHSKRDRIERLEPDIRGGRFRFPILVHNLGGGSSYWSVCTEERRAQQTAKKRAQRDYRIGEIVYEPAKAPTKRMLEMERSAQRHRIVAPITRRDQNGEVYDLSGTIRMAPMMTSSMPHRGFTTSNRARRRYTRQEAQMGYMRIGGRKTKEDPMIRRAGESRVSNQRAGNSAVAGCASRLLRLLGSAF